MIITDPKSAAETFEQMLSAKKRQMNSLLEVTRAINNNVPVSTLWHSYESILITHLGIKNLSLFFFEHTLQKVVDINNDIEEETLPAWVLELTEFHKLSKQEQADLPGFTYIIPVYHKEHALAYALIGEINSSQGIMESDLLDFATVITNVVVVAVENKRLFKREIEKKQLDKELELASRVQGMLIPSRLPKNALYEFAGLYLPHRGIGGDYYDVIHVNRDEFYFCVADISGKGIASALVMANLQAYLNSSMMLNMPKEEFVKVLNQKITSITRGDHFITLFIAKYNIKTRALRYLNAGHNPPVLIHDGDIKILEKGCTILGAFEEIPKIEFGDEIIQPGTTIVCYTDGLTEMENEDGEFYGMDRLIEFVKQNYKLGPEIFNKILYDNVSKFKGNRLFNDDVSVLTCKLM
jgi:phosphoserine phosphatase RsbU/P